MYTVSLCTTLSYGVLGPGGVNLTQKYDVFCELWSFSNLSVTSPTSQLILQPFRRFTYDTAHSPTLQLLHLRHSSFCNPSFASPTSQALHLIHLASRPWHQHQRSLAPVINEFWWLWWPMISGDGWDVSFPDIFVFQLRKNPWKPSTRKTDPTLDRTRAC